MIKAKSVIPLLVGLGVGFYAVKLGVEMVKRAQGAGVGGPAVPVVVSNLAAPVGTEFTAEMLKLVEVPQALAPPQAVSDLEKVVGRVASHSLRPGGYISEDVLAPLGTPPGLSVRIPEGYRAVSVKVDEYSSVAGFLQPGSRVDVIAVLTRRSARKRDTVSRTILEGIEVAAVGQEMADPKDPGATVTRSVTLLVKPKDAALLHLADTKGKIRLALRQQDDGRSGQRGFASTSDLLDPQVETPQRAPEGNWWRGLAAGLASRAAQQDALAGFAEQPPVRLAAAPSPPRPWTVTVINGTKVQKLVFESPVSTRQLGSSSRQDEGLLNSGQGMGRYSDVKGQLLDLSDGESEESQWANPPED